MVADGTAFCAGVEKVRGEVCCDEEKVELDYEGGFFELAHYDEVLTQVYGDYMELPSESRRKKLASIPEPYWK